MTIYEMPTIEQIREMYPNPIESRNSGNKAGTYCVFKSALLMMNFPYPYTNFPTAHGFIGILRENLGFSTAYENDPELYELVNNGIIANDYSQFEKAYEYLGKALQYIKKLCR